MNQNPSSDAAAPRSATHQAPSPAPTSTSASPPLPLQLAPQRRKVLHVSTTAAGGLGTSLLSITQSLDPKRFEVEVAIGLGYPLDEAFARSGMRLHGLPLSRGIHPWQFAKTVVMLTKLMRRERYELVHVHGSEAGILARMAAALAGTRAIVVELHGYANRDPNSLLERSLYRWLEKALDGMTDAYVAVSHHVAKQWLERDICSPARLQVIHHALDLAQFPDPGLAPRLDITTDKALGRPLIGTVSLLEERKGLKCWVEAMPLILQACPQAQFAVVGEGPLRPWMEERTRELGIASAVHFLGWRKDAAQLMQAFDVFVQPSRRESFGLVLLEAMANRCPVVATRVDGIPEVVEHRVSGTLVPRDDAPALARAVNQLLRDPALASRYTQAGRLRVEQRFNQERMAQEYNTLYERLLDAPASVQNLGLSARHS